MQHPEHGAHHGDHDRDLLGAERQQREGQDEKQRRQLGKPVPVQTRPPTPQGEDGEEPEKEVSATGHVHNRLAAQRMHREQSRTDECRTPHPREQGREEAVDRPDRERMPDQVGEVEDEGIMLTRDRVVDHVGEHPDRSIRDPLAGIAEQLRCALKRPCRDGVLGDQKPVVENKIERDGTAVNRGHQRHQGRQRDCVGAPAPRVNPPSHDSAGSRTADARLSSSDPAGASSRPSRTWWAAAIRRCARSRRRRPRACPCTPG